MKIDRHTTEKVRVGDLVVNVEFGADGKVSSDDYVTVYQTDERGRQEGKPVLIMEAELVERIAHVILGRRLATNDHRYVCPIHGYVEAADCHDCSAEAGKDHIR